MRVIADGAWGFAASDDLSRQAVEATAARALSIAKASARVKQEDIRLAPEKPVVADWSTPIAIDPFHHLDRTESRPSSQNRSRASLRRGRHTRGNQYEFSSRGVMVRVLRWRRYSSDQVLDGRRICRLRFRRNRTPEAFLPEFVWRPVAEQRLRTGSTNSSCSRMPAGRPKRPSRCTRLISARKAI